MINFRWPIKKTFFYSNNILSKKNGLDSRRNAYDKKTCSVYFQFEYKGIFKYKYPFIFHRLMS